MVAARWLREYPGPVAYDWATRFSQQPPAPATIQEWEYFTYLCLELVKDTASHLAAAVYGWQYPASREALALAVIHDQILSAISSGTINEAMRYPRPWNNQAESDCVPLAADVSALLDSLS